RLARSVRRPAGLERGFRPRGRDRVADPVRHAALQDRHRLSRSARVSRFPARYRVRGVEVRTIGVVGAGQMGGGIAHAAAASGFHGLLADLEPEYLEKARATIGKNLDREVAKGKRTAGDKDAALGRIRASTALEDFARADVVIEAVVESEPVKAGVLAKLGGVVPGREGLGSENS